MNAGPRTEGGDAASESLVRAIGTFGLAAAIINITVGGGIFRLPASVAGPLGAAAPLAYVVCALAMTLIVLCIADAGSRVSLTGGPYAYIATAFGGYAGFVSGVLLWMVGLFATAAVSTVFAAGLGVLVPALAGRVMEGVTIAAALAFWTIINARGVQLGNRMNGIATVAKLVPLVLLAVGGLFFIEPANLAWTAPPSTGDVIRTSLLLIFAFAGIEVALVPSGEVRNPSRTVPRGIALAMGGITLIYILLQVVAQGVLGAALPASTASPLADAARLSLGGWAGAVLLAGASISMFGYLGGMTLSMPRIVYAFARDGYLPRMFAAIDARTHAPVAAIVLQSVLSLMLAVTGTFEKLAVLANTSALALYLGCALAAWHLRRLGIEGTGAGFRVPFARALPWITVAVILCLLAGLTRGEWIAFLVCLAAASVLYVIAPKARPAISAR